MFHSCHVLLIDKLQVLLCAAVVLPQDLGIRLHPAAAAAFVSRIPLNRSGLIGPKQFQMFCEAVVTRVNPDGAATRRLVSDRVPVPLS